METVADKELCAHAFRVLLGRLEESEVPELRRGEAGGMFVTWNKKDRIGEYDLRGCIGSLSQINVGRSLGYYAEQAAFHDSRFRPISKAELKDLQVGVSLLHTFEPAPGGVYDWEVGKHGIILNIERGRTYSATYLPEVASEQRWDQKQSVASLALKAGYRGALSKDILEASSVTRYQSAKCAMTYQEFMEYDKKA